MQGFQVHLNTALLRTLTTLSCVKTVGFRMNSSPDQLPSPPSQTHVWSVPIPFQITADCSIVVGCLEQIHTCQKCLLQKYWFMNFVSCKEKITAMYLFEKCQEHWRMHEIEQSVSDSWLVQDSDLRVRGLVAWIVHCVDIVMRNCWRPHCLTTPTSLIDLTCFETSIWSYIFNSPGRYSGIAVTYAIVGDW